MYVNGVFGLLSADGKNEAKSHRKIDNSIIFRKNKAISVKDNFQNGYIVGYDDENNFCCFCEQGRNFLNDEQKRYLVNEMIKYKINKPTLNTNTQDLTYLEVINYAKLNSTSPDCICDYINITGNLESSITTKQDQLNLINQLKMIKKPNNCEKDFIIVPLRLEKQGYNHFANAIINFNEQEKNIIIYDSCNGGYNNFYNIDDVKYYPDQNLQGESNTCGYWSTNCAILASNYKNFNDLEKELGNGKFTTELTKQMADLLNDINVFTMSRPEYESKIQQIQEEECDYNYSISGGKGMVENDKPIILSELASSKETLEEQNQPSTQQQEYSKQSEKDKAKKCIYQNLNSQNIKQIIQKGEQLKEQQEQQVEEKQLNHSELSHF